MDADREMLNACQRSVQRDPSISIRLATSADVGEINQIYNHYVRHSTCVWSTTPCSAAERRDWFEEHGDTMPIIVAEPHRRVVGWAALSSFRAMYTTNGTLEDSVYVHHEFHRRGIGRALLIELIRAWRQRQLCCLLANISADQMASIRLHEELGFEKVAHLRRVGHKFGRWLTPSIYSCC
jgi:phosphinothricin acetyltransferase